MQTKTLPFFYALGHPLSKACSHSEFFEKNLLFFLFLSVMSEKQESTISESLNFTDSNLENLKKSKTISLAKISSIKQFSLIDLSCCDKSINCKSIGEKQYINPFHATGLFRYPLKTSENFWFSDVFRGY